MVDKLISHHSVLEMIGKGGMGVVYEAKDSKLHRTVAMNFPVPKEWSQGDDFVTSPKGPLRGGVDLHVL